MANQVAALAGREPPVMMGLPCSSHGADPQAGLAAGTKGSWPGQKKEGRHR